MGTFRAVIEACGTYRWLYDLLRPHGTVLPAHPMRLRAMIQRRSKTDQLDAQLLVDLLRINQIPLAYIPPEAYQQLRDLTRCRAGLGRQLADVKIQLRALPARQKRESPYRSPFGPRGLGWFRGQEFGPIENMVRDELLERFRHYAKQMTLFDQRLEGMQQAFPQAESLLDIRDIGAARILEAVSPFRLGTWPAPAEKGNAAPGLLHQPPRRGTSEQHKAGVPHWRTGLHCFTHSRALRPRFAVCWKQFSTPMASGQVVAFDSTSHWLS